MNSCRIYFFYRAISTISSLIPFLDNQIPRPAPIKNETKLVIKTVKKTFLLVMKFLFLLSFEGNAESFELFELLILLEDEDFLLRIVANVHSLQGMFGLDDQSHMISDAVNSPWTSSGLTKWLI